MSNPALYGKCPGQKPSLHVRLIEGNGLAIKDFRTSDPYAKIWIQATGGPMPEKNAIQQSKVIKSDINPKWDEHFGFDLSIYPPGADGHYTHLELHIELWDKDVVTADDYMGEVTIPLF